MKRLAILILLVAATNAVAQTTGNDDSCDIAQQPAATLLLPYFEVDGSRATTLFTVRSVSANPQIARVTLWTDLGYPVLTFNLFLTGYGVMPINLSDVLLAGAIAPSAGQNPIVNNPTMGSQPAASNPLLDVSACSTGPSSVPAATLKTVQALLSIGHDPNACNSSQLGTAHPMMIGYATIDLVANCDARSPLDPAYFTHDLLFDNVLTGDYQQVNGGRLLGNSLVPIRAVPEGGVAGQIIGTTLPFTFYDRLTNGQILRTIDRRQPLPSAFAARWLTMGATGPSSDYRIWRESPVGNNQPCTDYRASMTALAELVRFDEHENAWASFESIIPTPGPPQYPSAMRLLHDGGTFPPWTSRDVAGWMYLNLNGGGSNAFSVSGGHDYHSGFRPNVVRQSQALVVTTLVAGPFAVSNDATAFGNGCSQSLQPTSVAPIGPAK